MLIFFKKTVNYTWIPHHQVWKQKGEEYRLFGGGGWVWTSGLQLRKRKRPGDEKDNFVNKKRKLLDTTNKIVALKEAKRKEVLKQEAEKAARLAAQRAPLQSTPVSQGVQTATKTTAASAPVQTSATTALSTTQSAPASQAVKTTTSTAASAPVQTSPATSSSAIQSATSQMVQATATASAATAPVQTAGAVQTTSASASAILTQPISSQMVQTTATGSAVTGPSLTAVTDQTTAASTSTTLTPAACSQMAQGTATITAVTGLAQTSVPVQTTAISTSATLTPAASSQLVQSLAITTATDFQAQISSTSRTLAQSSVQNVAFTPNAANTFTSVTPCTVTTATSTDISTSTSSTLPNVVSQNASPLLTSLPSSVIPSVSPSETTGHPVSAVCASPIPSTSTLLSGPVVQTSSGTALSTSLLTASNTSETFSLVEEDNSTSSSLLLNTDNSANKCPTPLSSAATIDIVSTTSPSARSSVSTASISKCPFSLPASSAAVENDNSTSSSLLLASVYSATLTSSSATIDIVSTTSSSAVSSVSTASMSESLDSLPDSSANMFPPNSAGISSITAKIENPDDLLEVESKPDTLGSVARDNIGDDTKALGSLDLFQADVSLSLAIPLSTTKVSSDVEKTQVSSLLSCQEHEDQVFNCSASPSSLTGAKIKSHSEVCSSSFPEQNFSESTVAQDYSLSDPCLPQNSSPCIPLSAEGSQVSDHNSNSDQKNDVLLGSSLCSNQVSFHKDVLSDDMKEENSSSASASQPRTEELMTDLSKDISETITRKNKRELLPGSDYVEQGPVQDKSSPLENHSVTSAEENIPEQHERLSTLSHVSMTNHDQEYLDDTKENAAESKGTSSDVDVFESPVVQSKESFLCRDEKKEDTAKEFQSSENNSLVYTQDTEDKVTDGNCLSDDVSPDNGEGHPSLLSREVSSVGPTEESEKESKFEDNKSVDNSGIKVDISDGGVLPSDSLVNECLTLNNDTQEDKADVAGVEVSVGTRDEGSHDFGEKPLLNDISLGSGGSANSDLKMEDASIATNDNLKINSSECKKRKSIDQSQCCTLDISRSEDVFDQVETAALSDIKATVATSSEVEKPESCTAMSVSVVAEPSDFESSAPLKADRHGDFGSVISDDSHDSETNSEDITMCDGRKAVAVNETSDGGESSELASSEVKVCPSVDSAQVAESSDSDERPSSAKPASSAPEMSSNPAEEPMDIDVITVSPDQSPAGVTSPLKCTNLQTEQPMDVDVTIASSTQSSNAATTPLTSDVLNTETCSQTALSTENTTISVASTSVTGPVLEETETETSNENLPDIAMPQPCLAQALGAVSTASAGGITTTNTANVTTTPVSTTLTSAATSSLSTASPSQSATQPSAPATSAVTMASQSSSFTASSAAAITLPATGTVKTAVPIGTQPVVSVVPSSAALASPGVATAGSQGMAIGGSPVLPLAQTIPAKGGGSPAVLTAAVTRGIAPQKIGIVTRPQGQTTQYVPIGPKPILPSPRTPALNTGLQGSTVRIGTQPAASGPSSVAPVNSIAALVASIPTSGTTIGPSQLIRLVTPDGRTLTLQGSQLAALAQQAASPLGLSAPKTITLQVSAAASQQKPGTSVQKTVGIKTPGAAISVQRPPQQVAQVKPQLVIKPKVETKPLKEEKFPSLEPIVKDPRVLLNRRLAKWPLRHSVKSVFRLPRHERRKLGRKAGMKEVSGYTYASRAVGVNWPAGIPRPSFKVAWRFRTQSLKTLAGAGLQLRILQSCLKWEEMNVRPPRGNSNTVYTSSGE